ncbi:uncharacterized protein LOC129601702, partial [Paramacrobiotus metropolitanus]|uniref:uncharacterized protein LOC129601702 n=1 Tax=Paramacrobiotus metropolitanus TaxID=2943436 RepID=UPI002445ED29
MPRFAVPENAQPYLPNLETETYEQDTNGFFLNYFSAFVQKDDNTGPYPLLSISTQYHFGPERKSRDVCVVASPHGARQVAPKIPGWIHESKPGQVYVKKRSAPGGRDIQDMLQCESRRSRIGKQLLDRFMNQHMLNQMESYGWKELWGSSGVGSRCTIWQMDFDNNAIYRMISCNEEQPEKELLKAVNDPNPIHFPAGLWNIGVEADQEVLEKMVGFSRGGIVGAVDKLRELDEERLKSLNVRLQNPAPVLVEEMDVDDSGDENSGSDSSYAQSSSHSSSSEEIKLRERKGRVTKAAARNGRRGAAARSLVDGGGDVVVGLLREVVLQRAPQRSVGVFPGQPGVQRDPVSPLAAVHPRRLQLLAVNPRHARPSRLLGLRVDDLGGGAAAVHHHRLAAGIARQCGGVRITDANRQRLQTARFTTTSRASTAVLDQNNDGALPIHHDKARRSSSAASTAATPPLTATALPDRRARSTADDKRRHPVVQRRPVTRLNFGQH